MFCLISVWSITAITSVVAAVVTPANNPPDIDIDSSYASGNQLHFAIPSEPLKADNDEGFSLVQAVHLGAHSYPGLNVRHVFTRNQDADPIAMASIYNDPPPYPGSGLKLKSVKSKIWRPSHPARSEVYEAARRLHFYDKSSKEGLRMTELASQLTWSEVEVDVPDVTDVETLSTLAKMSSNAYSTPKDGGWYDLSNATEHGGVSYNLSSSFGWEEDGIRGHVFSSSPNNETIIIAVKGTSAFSGGIGGPTGKNDKLNDNLLFSCCCARVDWSWSPVCDCYTGQPNTCNLTCLEDALIEKSVYYPTATDLFNNITAMYPTSDIWLTGHSLGGALASLLAVTFGIPCVTFEAPGDFMAARRLHLPLPPGADWEDNQSDFGITHVYTNSDPIPQGTCTGALSVCTIAGFALETKCHVGRTVMYDTVGKLGWSVDIRTHRIAVLIDKLLIEDWDKDSKEDSNKLLLLDSSEQGTSPASDWTGSWWTWPWRRKHKKGNKDEGDDNDDQPAPPVKKSHVPPAELVKDCLDCFKWEFRDDKDEAPPGNATSSLLDWTTSPSRRTRRSKCF